MNLKVVNGGKKESLPDEAIGTLLLDAEDLRLLFGSRVKCKTCNHTKYKINARILGNVRQFFHPIDQIIVPWLSCKKCETPNKITIQYLTMIKKLDKKRLKKYTQDRPQMKKLIIHLSPLYTEDKSNIDLSFLLSPDHQIIYYDPSDINQCGVCGEFHPINYGTVHVQLTPHRSHDYFGPMFFCKQEQDFIVPPLIRALMREVLDLNIQRVVFKPISETEEEDD